MCNLICFLVVRINYLGKHGMAQKSDHVELNDIFKRLPKLHEEPLAMDSY